MDTNSDSLDALHYDLKALYRAEKQLILTLDALRRNAPTESLRQIYQDHLQETKSHLRRLEQLGEMHGLELDPVTNDREHNSAINDSLDDAVLAETQREEIIISFLEELI
jgi:ferritin-like metal-binding protein YciE